MKGLSESCSVRSSIIICFRSASWLMSSCTTCMCLCWHPSEISLIVTQHGHEDEGPSARPACLEDVRPPRLAVTDAAHNAAAAGANNAGADQVLQRHLKAGQRVPLRRKGVSLSNWCPARRTHWQQCLTRSSAALVAEP